MNLRTRVYELEAKGEKEPPIHVPEPELIVSVPVLEKPAVRQSRWYGFSSKVLHISVKLVCSSVVTRLTVVL